MGSCAVTPDCYDGGAMPRSAFPTSVRLTPKERAAVAAAAEEAAMTTHAWLRQVALTAAGVSGLAEQLTRGEQRRRAFDRRLRTVGD